MSIPGSYYIGKPEEYKKDRPVVSAIMMGLVQDLAKEMRNKTTMWRLSKTIDDITLYIHKVRGNEPA